MPLFRLIALGLVVLGLAACSEEPATPGEAVDFAAVCDKTNDGRRVAVEGYLRFPRSFSDSQSVVLRLYKTSDFAGSPIGVQIRFGTEPNHVEKIGNKFSDTDLKVHLSNGQVAPFGTKVKVSGNVFFPLISQEFACSLTNPLVEAVN